MLMNEYITLGRSGLRVSPLSLGTMTFGNDRWGYDDVDTLSTLVREGKVRYYGFSDVPAWYAARGQTLAEYLGKEPIIALQMEYSLVERTIEREHIPAARELGMGVCPWLSLIHISEPTRRTPIS